MENIIIKNAYENNLKHIDLKIPLNSFTCVTGCSGSQTLSPQSPSQRSEDCTYQNS